MSSSVDRSPRRTLWRSVMRKYWKDASNDGDPLNFYSPHNIARMRLGKAPRRLALLRHKKTQELVEVHVPIELHHENGFDLERPESIMDFYPVLPWEHDRIDENRHFPFIFVEWRQEKW